MRLEQNVWLSLQWESVEWCDVCCADGWVYEESLWCRDLEVGGGWVLVWGHEYRYEISRSPSSLGGYPWELVCVCDHEHIYVCLWQKWVVLLILVWRRSRIKYKLHLLTSCDLCLDCILIRFYIWYSNASPVSHTKTQLIRGGYANQLIRYN